MMMKTPPQNRRKLGGLYWFEWVLLPLVGLGVIHVIPSFLSTPNKATESVQKQMLAKLNAEQQQSYAQRGTFLSQSRGVTRYQQELAMQTNPYNYTVRVLGDRVYTYAIPTPPYPHGEYFIFPWNRLVPLKSYVGVVVVSDRKTKTTQAEICGLRPLPHPVDKTASYGEPWC